MIEKPQLSQSGTLLAPTLKKEKKNNNTIKKDKTSREKKNTMKSRFKWYSIQKERGGAANKTRGIRYRARCMYVSCVRTPQHHPQLFFSSLSLSTVQWFFFSYSIPLFYTGKRIKITKTKIGKFWSLRKLWRLLSVACNHPTQSGQWLPQAGVVYRRTWAVRFSYTDGAVREKGRRTFRCSAEKK